MSLSNQTVQQIYAANGSNKNFAVPFSYIPGNPSHIKVKTKNPMGVEVLVNESLYSFTPNNINPTTVVFTTAPLSGLSVLVYREMPFVQLLDYINSGPFQAESHEQAMDFMTMLIQQLAQQLKRIPAFSRFWPTNSPYMEDPVAGRALLFDIDGNIKNSSASLEDLVGEASNSAADAAAAEAAAVVAQAAAAAAELAAANSQASASASATTALNSLATITAIVGSLLTQTQHTFTGGQASTLLLNENFDGGSYLTCIINITAWRGPMATATTMYNMTVYAQFVNGVWIAIDGTQFSDNDPDIGLYFTFNPANQLANVGRLELAADAGANGGIIIKKNFFSNGL